MVRVIMYDCNGAMGQVVTGLVSQIEDITIVTGIDMVDSRQDEHPVFTSLEDCDVAVDVIVDLAPVKAVDHLSDYCAARKLPVVVCITGLSEEQTAKVVETVKEVVVSRSANVLLGVNLLLRLAVEAARILVAAGSDMETAERHHNQKVDALSGTALVLVDSLNGAMGGKYHYQYDRSTKKEKCDRKEIGIQSVRGGFIAGEYDVISAGQDEVVTFSHTAYFKAIFAKGVIEAARSLTGEPAGLYNVSDVIG